MADLGTNLISDEENVDVEVNIEIWLSSTTLANVSSISFPNLESRLTVFSLIELLRFSPTILLLDGL